MSKLDIFQLMGKIDKGDYLIWDKLSEQEKKEFSPYMTMKWMTGTTDARQVIFMNELVNSLVFDLGKHPSLLLKLLTCASSKSNKHYKYMGLKKSKNVNKKTEILKKYYNYNTKEAKESIHLVTNDDLLEMASELGYQEKELKKLKRELK